MTSDHQHSAERLFQRFIDNLKKANISCCDLFKVSFAHENSCLYSTIIEAAEKAIKGEDESIGTIQQD